MPTAIYGVSLSAGGVSIQQSVNRAGDHTNSYEVTLPVGHTVTDWVKTDANTAACNLPSGHGQTNGNFDVYWSGGARYGVPGTISTNALTLDGGAGDDFPASATTGIVVTKQVEIETMFNADSIQIIGICVEAADPNSDAIAHLDVQNDGGNVAEVDLVANVPQVFDVAGGASNPFTDADPNIILTLASNGDATDALTLKIVTLLDSTP